MDRIHVFVKQVFMGKIVNILIHVDQYRVSMVELVRQMRVILIGNVIVVHHILVRIEKVSKFAFFDEIF
jgi:hypothetical protein